MIKAHELTNPNSCLNKAREDEYVFVLLERDVAAPAAISAWIQARIRLGKNKPNDPQILEAEQTILMIEESLQCRSSRTTEVQKDLPKMNG